MDLYDCLFVCGNKGALDARAFVWMGILVVSRVPPACPCQLFVLLDELFVHSCIFEIHTDSMEVGLDHLEVRIPKKSESFDKYEASFDGVVLLAETALNFICECRSKSDADQPCDPLHLPDSSGGAH